MSKIQGSRKHFNDIEAYQRLLDIAACANAAEGIRQGLEDSRRGKTSSIEEFFEEFDTLLKLRKKLGRQH